MTLCVASYVCSGQNGRAYSSRPRYYGGGVCVYNSPSLSRSFACCCFSSSSMERECHALTHVHTHAHFWLSLVSHTMTSVSYTHAFAHPCMHTLSHSRLAGLFAHAPTRSHERTHTGFFLALPSTLESPKHVFLRRFREREKFIIRPPPIGDKDDYDRENSWISDGLPSSKVYVMYSKV